MRKRYIETLSEKMHKIKFLKDKSEKHHESIIKNINKSDIDFEQLKFDIVKMLVMYHDIYYSLKIFAGFNTYVRNEFQSLCDKYLIDIKKNFIHFFDINDDVFRFVSNFSFHSVCVPEFDVNMINEIRKSLHDEIISHK